MTKINKIDVLGVCANLLIEGEGATAKEAVRLAKNKGVRVTFREVEELRDKKLQIYKELYI
jgi:hypothetical protein